MSTLRQDHDRVRRHLSLFLATLVTGLMVIVIVAYVTARAVRVGGPSYARIIDKKELIADILPPPGYVVESYLLVYQLIDEPDEQRRSEKINRLASLENQYRRSHDRWSSKHLSNELQRALVQDSFVPADDFYQGVRDEFLPAVHRGDQQGAHLVVHERLKHSFEQHRLAIHRTVLLAQAESAETELATAQLIEQRTVVLVALLAAVALTVVGLGVVLGRRILLVNRLLAHELAERRRVEDNLRASETLRRDALTRDSAFKSALLYSISHDLRSPLASIGASAQMLMSSSGPERVQQIEAIEKNSQEMLHLVSNLLEMLRLESGALDIRRELQFVGDVVDAAVARMKHALQDRVIQVRLETDLPPVKIDEVLFMVVLTNLIDNAIKYSPERSSIVIEGWQKEKCVELTMTNEVNGTVPESWEELFLPFRRNPSSSPVKIRGTGLGLTICRGIMHAHGGRISIESNPDGRTTILLALPIAEEEWAAKQGDAIWRPEGVWA